MFRLHVVFSDLKFIILEAFPSQTSQIAELLSHTVDHEVVVDV